MAKDAFCSCVVQGVDMVWGYVPDALWYDYESVRTSSG